MKLKRLAIFVEGQTEQLFLKPFIEEIAGHKNVTFDLVRFDKAKHILSMKQRRPPKKKTDPKYEIMIVNCENDERVKSVVLEHRDSLIAKNYSLILGLRDLKPTPYAELAKVKRGLKYGVPTAKVPTYILLAVHEIEAWFLQEHLHYKKIHRKLDVSKFKALFGFDPTIDTAEHIPDPCGLLKKIYKSTGKSYSKKKSVVAKTVRALDHGNLYINLQPKLPHMAELVRHIDRFVS